MNLSSGFRLPPTVKAALSVAVFVIIAAGLAFYSITSPPTAGRTSTVIPVEDPYPVPAKPAVLSPSDVRVHNSTIYAP